MRVFHLILILILTFSCSNTERDNRIKEFEKILGKNESKALNLLVSDFEKNLIKIYPNLSTEKAYKKYLSDLLSESTSEYDKFKFQSDKTTSEFHQSGLWNEIYEFSYAYDVQMKDSIKVLNINNTGKFMQALYEVKDSDSLIKNYWKKREAAGMMQNEIVIPGILSLNPDFNDYFHKRIVVIEFSF
jgi:hypothetical protein